MVKNYTFSYSLVFTLLDLEEIANSPENYKNNGD